MSEMAFSPIAVFYKFKDVSSFTFTDSAFKMPLRAHVAPPCKIQKGVVRDWSTLAVVEVSHFHCSSPLWVRRPGNGCTCHQDTNRDLEIYAYDDCQC